MMQPQDQTTQQETGASERGSEAVATAPGGGEQLSPAELFERLTDMQAGISGGVITNW